MMVIREYCCLGVAVLLVVTSKPLLKKAVAAPCESSWLPITKFWLINDSQKFKAGLCFELV
jgi:hypothetical protein